jgi:hypothetical protein
VYYVYSEGLACGLGSEEIQANVLFMREKSVNHLFISLGVWHHLVQADLEAH